MAGLVKSFDNLPWIAKLILALPFIDGIAWGIYRVAKGISKNDMTLIIIGVIWIILGMAILWIIDLVTIILYKKPTVFV